MGIQSRAERIADGATSFDEATLAQLAKLEEMLDDASDDVLNFAYVWVLEDYPLFGGAAWLIEMIETQIRLSISSLWSS